MALLYPDILQHNNTTKALTDITEVRGNSYPINLLSDTGSIPADKRKVGAIVFVSSSQNFYGFYGQTVASWDTTSNWRPLTNTGSFATTGSNVFIGNQTITGSLNVSSSISGNKGNLDFLYIKSNPNNPDLSATIAISKNITASTAHIIEDSSTITPPIGADGYGLVDLITTITGSNPPTHIHGYQSRILYKNSANMPIGYYNSLTSFYSENQVYGPGVVDRVIGLKVLNTFMAAANKINNQYGIWIENQTVGAVNYGIWNDTRGNYFKGLSIGTETIDLANTLKVSGSVSITGSLMLNDILVLTPRTTTPAPSPGMVIVSGSGADQHLYCYLNSTWKQLD